MSVRTLTRLLSQLASAGTCTAQHAALVNVCVHLWIYEFAGLEPRIGLLEWTTGMDHWSGLLDLWTTGLTFEPVTGNRAHNYY